MASILDYNVFAGGPPILSIQPSIDCNPMNMNKPHHGGPVYYRQPEVIQLVEVSAPPPLQQPSTITSASVPSSSFYSESCESSETDSEEDEDATSYCSSDDDMEDNSQGYYDDTYGTRLGRVLAWRDSFAKAMGVAITSADALSASYSSLLKRKINIDLVDDDALSLSKRSRPDSQVEPGATPWPRRRLSSHSCSACDSDFATRQSLREHGRDPRREACRAAVEYDLE